jgi:type IV pilus assembly protein PilC
MRFKYIIVNNKGEKLVGYKEANNKEEIFTYFNKVGYTVISIQEDIFFNFKKIFKQEIGGIPLKDKVFLFKQLKIMIKAAVPVLQIIDILRQQTQKYSIKVILDNIYNSIESGKSISQSFSQQKSLVSEVQASLLEVGEKSGKLPEIITKITEDLEKQFVLRSKIVGALIYPIIIFVLLLGVIIFMIIFMVPQIKDLYNSFGQTELPVATKILVGIGELFTNLTSVIPLLVLILGSIVGFITYSKTNVGKINLERLRLKIPIIGNLYKLVQIVQLTRVLYVLLDSGVSIINALEISKNSVNSYTLKNIISNSKEDVIKGLNLSVALSKDNTLNFIPEIILKLIAVGEESGQISSVLKDINNFYEQELDQVTKNLTKTLEPLIMLVVGIMVMFLALAVYSPTVQLIQNIS